MNANYLVKELLPKINVIPNTIVVLYRTDDNNKKLWSNHGNNDPNELYKIEKQLGFKEWCYMIYVNWDNQQRQMIHFTNHDFDDQFRRRKDYIHSKLLNDKG